jgi:coatomer protein complex subunit gamma
MSTSIIMKDTAVGSDVLYRANAIRALCRIIDVCRCDLKCFEKE